MDSSFFLKRLLFTLSALLAQLGLVVSLLGVLISLWTLRLDWGVVFTGIALACVFYSRWALPRLTRNLEETLAELDRQKGTPPRETSRSLD